jgi:hypothetical protein
MAGIFQQWWPWRWHEWEYPKPMKAEKNTEFEKFQGALRTVLSVSHQELQRRLEQEKMAKEGMPKRGPKPRKVTGN